MPQTSANWATMRGGWDPLPDYATKRFSIDALVESNPGLENVVAWVNKHYRINPDTLRLALSIAYKIDTAMMMGNVSALTKARGLYKNKPYLRKFVTMLRKRIHRGGTRGSGKARRERTAAARAALRNAAWYGSDPYVNGLSSGAYRYLGLYTGSHIPKGTKVGRRNPYGDVASRIYLKDQMYPSSDLDDENAVPEGYDKPTTRRKGVKRQIVAATPPTIIPPTPNAANAAEADLAAAATGAPPPLPDSPLSIPPPPMDEEED